MCLNRCKPSMHTLRSETIFEVPLKIIKNYFYFTLKALLVLNIFEFLSWSFGHVEKRLEIEGWFQDLWRHNLGTKQLQYIYCPIFYEVKAINWEMKFGQLIEYNMRNVFLEK